MRYAATSLIWLSIIAACLTPAQPAQGQGSLAEYNAKLRAINTMDPEDWYRLGTWCKSRMMWTYARGAFTKAMDLGPGYKAKCCYELAMLERGSKKIDAAIAWLEKAREADANFGPANKLYEQLKGAKRVVSQGKISEVVNAYEAKQYSKTIAAVEALVGKPGKDNMADMAEKLTEALGEDVYKALAKCRLRGRCARCSGEGHVECRRCLGKGYRMRKKIKRLAKDKDEHTLTLWDIERKKYLQVCSTCEGMGARLCKVCNGSGLNIVRAYDGEKALLAEALVKRAEALSKSLRGKRKSKHVVKHYKRALKAAAMYEEAAKLDRAAAEEVDEKLDSSIEKAQKKLKSAKAKLAKRILKEFKRIAEESGSKIRGKHSGKKGKK